MKIHTDYLEVKKTARFATAGNLTLATRYFWFVLHGSHMTCEQMLYKFSDFDPDTHFVVSPEGLSRNYLNGFGGETIATWMTSRDRLHEIADFSLYLSQLYNQYQGSLQTDCKKIVMGFSQGGTVALRWLHQSKVELDVKLTYSSPIPNDIDLKKGKTDLSKIQYLYTYGNQDPYLTPERLQGMKHLLKINNLDATIESYDGTHKVDKEQLQFLFNTYIQ